MRWWELFRQALSGVARARLRSTLTAMGIAIGGGALASMVAFALGLQQQMERPFEKLGLLNDIHVQPHGAADDDEDDAAPRASTTDSNPNKQPDETESSADAELETPGDAADQPSRLLDETALEEFRAIPGVKYAYPEIRLSDVEIARGESKTRAFAISLPREASLLSMAEELLLAGDYFTLDDSPQAIVGDGLRDQLGYETAESAIDQKVLLSAAGLASEGDGRFQLARKQVEVTIVGVFQSPGFGPFGPRGGDSSILLPVDVMLGLPGVVESQIHRFRDRGGGATYEGYGRVIVRVDRPSEVFDVEQSIQELGFRTRTMLSNLEDARTFFLFLEVLLASVGTVALIVAGLGIANTLLMTVLERFQEIGVYKAIGATDGDVRLLFLFEASLLGLIGGIVGLGLARMVCWGLQLGIDAYLRHQGVDRSVEVFDFPWWLSAGTVAFAAVISILSGLYPASRAARVDPIEALRRA